MNLFHAPAIIKERLIERGHAGENILRRSLRGVVKCCPFREAKRYGGETASTALTVWGSKQAVGYTTLKIANRF